MKALVALASSDRAFLDRGKKLLEAANYAVITYEDPAAVLEALGSVRFDVLVTTVVLGSSNGFDLAQKAVKRLPDLRVLYASKVHMQIDSEAGSVGTSIAYEFTTEAFEHGIKPTGIRSAQASATLNEIQAYLAQRFVSGLQ